MEEIRYARAPDGGHVAFTCSGDGPVTVLEVSTFANSIGAPLDYPGLHRWMQRVGSFAKHVRYDRRGLGISDPLTGPPSLEPWCEDALAVLDAIEAKRCVPVGLDQVSGQTAAVLAATFPDRFEALVLVNSSARLSWAPDNEWGIPPHVEERLEARIAESWPDVFPLEALAPSAANDPQLRAAWKTMAVVGASPKNAVATSRVIYENDIRHVLPAIRVPTLVIHSKDDRMCPFEHGRYLAEHIAGSKLVEVPGGDHVFTMALSERLADEIELFLTGQRAQVTTDRVLATVLFTDIVDSTAQASGLGDHFWQARLDAHDAMVRRQLARFRGNEIKTLGDGFLATFDGPGRAVNCATAIRDGAQQLGLQVRAGLHTGEIQQRGGDIAGLTVNIAARVTALAGAGEVVVTKTVTDLLAGSGISFAPRGQHELKGLPGTWEILSVTKSALG